MLKRCRVAEGWLEAGQAARIRAGEAGPRRRRGRPCPPPAVDRGSAVPGRRCRRPTWRRPRSCPQPGCRRASCCCPSRRSGPRRGPAAGSRSWRRRWVTSAWVLAVVAGLIAVTELWPGITTGAQLATRRGGHRRARGRRRAGARRRSARRASAARSASNGLLSTACLVAFMRCARPDQIWHFSPVDHHAPWRPRGGNAVRRGALAAHSRASPAPGDVRGSGDAEPGAGIASVAPGSMRTGCPVSASGRCSGCVGRRGAPRIPCPAQRRLPMAARDRAADRRAADDASRRRARARPGHRGGTD